MWINIDLVTSRIVHKCSDIEVARMLAHIECSGNSLMVECGNANSIRLLSVIVLRDMYKASTGHELLTYDNHMARLIADLCNRMPETKANEVFVRVQRYAVGMKDDGHYKYDPDKMKPLEMGDDWYPPALPGVRNTELENDTKYIAL